MRRFKYLLIALLTLSANLGFSQEAAATSDQMIVSTLMITLWVLIAALVVLIVLFGDYAFSEYKRTDSPMPWYIQLFGMFKGDYGWVAGDAKDAVIEGHDYDGIEEFDNDLPMWWKVGFYITILFGVVYIMVYHVFNTAPLQTAEFEASMVEASEKYANVDLVYDGPEEDETVLAGIQPDFEKTCGTCHNKDGGGNSGPNLTDPYWIYGGDINTIYETIKFGRKGESVMPPQGTKFSNDQIYQLASYVMSLQGSNPENVAPRREKETIVFPVEE